MITTKMKKILTTMSQKNKNLYRRRIKQRDREKNNQLCNLHRCKNKNNPPHRNNNNMQHKTKTQEE